jgi:hypothetical protein
VSVGYVVVNAFSLLCVSPVQTLPYATEPNFVCDITLTREPADVMCIFFCVFPSSYRGLLSIIAKLDHVLSVVMVAVVSLHNVTLCDSETARCHLHLHETAHCSLMGRSLQIRLVVIRQNL